MGYLRSGLFSILIILFVCLLFQHIKAEQLDIKGETERYKKTFIAKRDYGEICKQLKLYMDYIERTLIILNEEFSENKSLYNKIQKYGKFENYKVILNGVCESEVLQYKTYLDENGIKLRFSEGNIYLYFDAFYIVENFKNILPDKILEYFILEAEDINEGFEEDGALIIQWDNLRMKIIRFEKYLNEVGNIDCSYVEELTKQKISKYLNAYLQGIDNSRVPDRIEDVRNSYENFIDKNKDSRFYQIINNYYLVLQKNQFKFRQREEIKEGVRYIYSTILTDENEEIPLEVLVDNYLMQAEQLY